MVTALASLDAADPAGWDALVPPGGAPLRHGFLSAWQRAQLPGLRPRPLVIATPGRTRPLAAAAAVLYDLDMSAISRPILPRAIGVLRRARPRLMVTRVLELGAPAARIQPLLVAPDADAHAVARELLAAAVELAAQERAAMTVVQDLVPAGGPTALALVAAGFSRVPALPTAVLAVRYATFDGYLGAMRHKYRRRARMVLRASAHLEVEHLPEFATIAPAMARLWRLVYERAAETRREILPREFFAAATRVEGLSALVLRRPDASIAAFGLLMDDRPCLHFLQCGFEARAGREEGAYFRLLLELVRHGIESGFAEIDLGCTTLGPKLDLGAVPVELCAWIRHRRALVQRVFAAGGNGPFAPAPVEPRRVFAAA
jgi:hypothetical protein